MRILRLGAIAGAGLAIGLAAQLSAAQPQIEAPRIEAPRIVAPPVIAPTTAPSLAPSVTPAFSLPAPAPAPAPAPQPQAAPLASAPAIAGGGPPNYCRPKTAGDCAAEAVSCLAAKGISDRYHVAGEGSATGIYASRDYASQHQAEAAGDCAKDLRRCMAGGC